MRAIDKFILHVVHNIFPLNEYSEGELKRLMAQFREEADDLNINISDDTLKTYIQRFDAIKNSPKIQEKDLRKYTLSKLIKLVTSSAGAEAPDDEEDQTPDVVYQDGGITVWNGSKEDNCINYGRGEKWCITRGSFGNYRYDSSKGYPTFYLAKNNNMSDSDRLSFVAIQVRDVDDENRKYVYTNRQNSPYESSPMSFSKLTSEVPWLNDIPNIRGILRYIPLSSKEKVNQQYKRDSVSIREWTKMPFNVKKQYLIVRKDRTLFDDITNDVFVSDYLPKYPQIAEFIAITPDIIKPELLLRNLDKFSNQDRKSITANIQQPIDLKWLPSELFPFDVKKLLTVLKKWDIPSNERIYVTKNGEAIVKLKFGDTVSVGVYTAEDDYPNIKLNQRTSKYLLDYPELDKLPFNSLLKLATDGIVDKEFINKVIEKAKSEENSAIIVKKVEDGEILIDANSFSSYKIKDGKITKVPFNDEEVQAALGDEKENTAFQQGVVNIIKNSADTGENIPVTIDKDAFISILKSTSYDRRKFTSGRNQDQQVILIPDGESQYAIFTRPTETPPSADTYTGYNYGRRGDWREQDNRDPMGESDWRAYFAYLRNENQVYDSAEIIRSFRYGGNTENKKAFFRAQPPLSPTDQYATAIGTNGIYYLVNKANPRTSLKLSETSGKLISANIPSSLARQLISATPDEATPTAPGAVAPTAPAAGRRGRPAGGGQPRAAAPAAPAEAGGDINVSDAMEEAGLGTAFLRLPRPDYRRLNVTTGVRVNPNGDRGAARRNNQLGGAGRVGRVIEVGASKIYFIRLANAQIIASINVQPGNRNYVLLGNENGNVAVSMNSPAELMAVLQQRNLAEIRNYLVREYIANNPQHLGEVRELIRQHVNEKLNEGVLSKAITGLTLAAALFAGSPAQAQTQNPIVAKASNFLKKLKPTVKADTVKVKEESPLILSKFKDYKEAGYGHAESPDQAMAYRIAKSNAMKDLLKKMGQQQITAGFEEKDVRYYQNPDGSYECEVLVVIGNI
jgi:hypothetical protein